MAQAPYPYIWFDKEADEAMEFYCEIFPNSSIKTIERYPNESLDSNFKAMQGKILTGIFELGGQKFGCIDGGKQDFSLNSSISFMVNFDPSRDSNARQSLEEIWRALIEGGEAIMPLDSYDFSPLYGWAQDKYGVSWQLILTDPDGEPRPFIIPSLMFGGKAQNMANSAIDYYVSLFNNSARGLTVPYSSDTGPAKAGSILFADFTLENAWFVANDSGVDQDFDFNNAISLVIECKDQEEIDYFWNALSAKPDEEQCGWCTDKYGVRWQVVPANQEELIHTDTQIEALMKMKKISIKDLEQAA